MSGTEPRLATFCHISELGEEGYRDLHLMVAMSRPLNLWAPSSVLLESPSCRVRPEQFVYLVESGQIRILARHEWLVDRRLRDSHPWEGARWTEKVDGRIRAIMEEDLAEPDPERRRVVGTGPEQGMQFAQEQIDSDPQQAELWQEVLSSERAVEVIPRGTLEAARRYGGHDTRQQAVVVLRDAYNHAQAMADASADVPFLMTAAHRAFADQLASMPGVRRGRVDGPPARPTAIAAPTPLDEATAQIIDVLRRIRTDESDFSRFIGSDGHKALISWAAVICERIRTDGVAVTERQIADELAQQLASDELPKPIREAVRKGLKPLVVAGQGLTLYDALEPLLAGGHPDLMTAIHLAVFAALPTAGLAATLGSAPTDYQGTQWPYMYAGVKHNVQGRGELLQRLMKQRGARQAGPS